MYVTGCRLGQPRRLQAARVGADQTAAMQPSTYEEPGYGSQAEPASYDDGGDFGGGDEWA